ncbi:unnamed protein product [marine sediment metagenome]|uniref:Uncharacterized protein n=1 Tax=marine sediment metagenome TaxID=412755 RepID=X1HAQ1_9ZZZZ
MHSAQGYAAASGDAYTKLCVSIGVIMDALDGLWPFAKWILVPVNEWKGQLPKPVVVRRVRQVLGKLEDEQGKTIATHAIDATGIGLWVKGAFE